MTINYLANQRGDLWGSISRAYRENTQERHGNIGTEKHPPLQVNPRREWVLSNAQAKRD